MKTLGIIASNTTHLFAGEVEAADVPRFDTMTAHVEEGLGFLTG
jgi:hypothetical protein